MDAYENEIQLIDILNVIWKRKWLIIIPAFFLAVAAGIVSFLIPPKWEVDAILQPSKFFVQTEQGQFEEVFVADPRQIAGQINQNSFNSLIASELNLNLRQFPKISAQNLRDTKLVRVIIRDKDVARAKSILQKLFDILRTQLDKKINVEVKAIDSKITTNEREIKNKELNIQSKEIEKSKTKQQILSAENKLKISEQRFSSITEEMKSVKKRTEEIEKQQRESLEGKKEGMEAISLLLYSNEVQQNLRYYNTLEERLSAEEITQENLRLAIKEGQEEIRQFNTDIEKLKNEMEESKNQISLLNDKKARIDYAQLVKEPTSSLYPVSPRKKRNVLIAGMLGAFAFTMLAFLLEYVEKQRITNNKKLEVTKEKN
jgi:capsular polysaccharide biosynthesis protein